MIFSSLRAALFIDPMIVVATVVMGTISAICAFFDPGGEKQHAVAHAWARMLLRICGVRLRILGRDHLGKRNYVFVGNHLSLIDTPVVLGTIEQHFVFLVNAKFVKLPFLGTHLRRAGHYSVDPDDTRSSLRIMTEAAKRIREGKLSVLVFPEGSRSRTGELAEFKEGAAVIAIKAGVPVLPFAIRGTRGILPVGTILVRPGPVELIFGEPIPTEGMTLRDRVELTARMREQVVAMQQELESAEGYGTGAVQASVSE